MSYAEEDTCHMRRRIHVICGGGYMSRMHNDNAIYIYIKPYVLNTHTHTHTQRERERDTHRHTHTHTCGQQLFLTVGARVSRFRV